MRVRLLGTDENAGWGGGGMLTVACISRLVVRVGINQREGCV